MTIISNANVAGIYSDSVNTTIMNSNISMGSGAGGYGIRLYGANNSYVYNNILNEQRIGLYLERTNNIRIDNNTANSNSIGMSVRYSGLNNIFEGNELINSSGHGVEVLYGAINTTIKII